MMMLSGADVGNVIGTVESAPPTLASANGLLAPFTTVAKAIDILAYRTTPSLTSDQIFAHLEDMRIPPPVLEKATPRFVREGFVVADDKTNFKGDRQRPYTTAVRPGCELVLMHVPPQLFEDLRTWPFLLEVIENVKGSVRFVAQDRGDTSPGFNNYLKKSAGPAGTGILHHGTFCSILLRAAPRLMRFLKSNSRRFLCRPVVRSFRQARWRPYL